MKNLAVYVPVLGFLLAFLVGVGYGWRQARQAHKRAAEWFEQLRAGELEPAYAATTQEFRVSTSLQVFSDDLAAAALVRPHRARWKTCEFGTTRLLLVSKCQSNRGWVDVEVDMHLVQGQWRVHSVCTEDSMTHKGLRLAAAQVQRPGLHVIALAPV